MEVERDVTELVKVEAVEDVEVERDVIELVKVDAVEDVEVERDVLEEFNGAGGLNAVRPVYW